MKRLIAVTMAALMLSATPLLAGQGRGNGNGKGNKKNDDKHESRGNPGGGGGNTNVAVRVAWGTTDVQVIRTYYAPQYQGRRLPPGLAKKYARTGQLPPGWQKKMQPMPVELERRLPPLPPAHHRGIIDGVAVIYDQRGLIVDVAMLF